MTIHKYALAELDGPGGQIVMMPVGADPLYVARDPMGALSMWAEVDPRQPMVGATIYTVPTGGAMPTDARHHISTLIDGALVWHFYCTRRRLA